jgi:hypothetical protein
VNQEEQRAAIAEACGWTLNPAKHTAKGLDWLHVPSGNTAYNPPNYLNDLNAMHCAEEMLADDQWVEYRENIRTVVLGPVRYVSQWCKADIHSTARQRAEAFLRTIGKWKEVKP